MASLDRSSVRTLAAHVRSVHRRNSTFSRAYSTATTADESLSMFSELSRRHEARAAEKGIAAAIVIVGILILGILTWRIGKWRRQKIRAASNSINVSLMEKTRSGKDIHIDFDSAGRELERPGTVHVVWPAAPAASAKRSSTGRPWTHTFVVSFPGEKNDSVPSDTTCPRDENIVGSPPPSYAFVNGAGSSPSDARIMPPALDIPSRPNTSHAMVPSPRSSSFGVDSPLYKDQLTVATAKQKAMLSSKSLPRTMVVQSTFKPSLSDELLIRVGETLTMLEEYEDEWCLVQRPGASPDMQKGVVPLFCLREQR